MRARAFATTWYHSAEQSCHVFGRLSEDLDTRNARSQRDTTAVPTCFMMRACIYTEVTAALCDSKRDTLTCVHVAKDQMQIPP